MASIRLLEFMKCFFYRKRGCGWITRQHTIPTVMAPAWTVEHMREHQSAFWCGAKPWNIAEYRAESAHVATKISQKKQKNSATSAAWACSSLSAIWQAWGGQAGWGRRGEVLSQGPGSLRNPGGGVENNVGFW